MECANCHYLATPGEVVEGACPHCQQPYRSQPNPLHSDMEMRNMPAPGEKDMGGNPLQEGILADNGWQNRTVRDESFASVQSKKIMYGPLFHEAADFETQDVIGPEVGHSVSVVPQMSPGTPGWHNGNLWPIHSLGAKINGEDFHPNDHMFQKGEYTLSHEDPEKLEVARKIAESGAVLPEFASEYHYHSNPHEGTVNWNPMVGQALGQGGAVVEGAQGHKPYDKEIHESLQEGQPVNFRSSDPQYAQLVQEFGQHGDMEPLKAYFGQRAAKTAGDNLLEDLTGADPFEFVRENPVWDAGEDIGAIPENGSPGEVLQSAATLVPVGLGAKAVLKGASLAKGALAGTAAARLGKGALGKAKSFLAFQGAQGMLGGGMMGMPGGGTTQAMPPQPQPLQNFTHIETLALRDWHPSSDPVMHDDFPHQHADGDSEKAYADDINGIGGTDSFPKEEGSGDPEFDKHFPKMFIYALGDESAEADDDPEFIDFVRNLAEHGPDDGSGIDDLVAEFDQHLDVQLAGTDGDHNTIDGKGHGGHIPGDAPKGDSWPKGATVQNLPGTGVNPGHVPMPPQAPAAPQAPNSIPNVQNCPRCGGPLSPEATSCPTCGSGTGTSQQGAQPNALQTFADFGGEGFGWDPDAAVPATLANRVVLFGDGTALVGQGPDVHHEQIIEQHVGDPNKVEQALNSSTLIDFMSNGTAKVHSNGARLTPQAIEQRLGAEVGPATVDPNDPGLAQASQQERFESNPYTGPDRRRELEILEGPAKRRDYGYPHDREGLVRGGATTAAPVAWGQQAPCPHCGKVAGMGSAIDVYQCSQCRGWYNGKTGQPIQDHETALNEKYQTPVQTLANQTPMPSPVAQPAQEIPRSDQSSAPCANCGAVVSGGTGVCPMCHQPTTPSANPQAPVSPPTQLVGPMAMPGGQPAQYVGKTAASHMGPHNNEQFHAVAELLTEEGRQAEIPDMLLEPHLYAEELARAQNKMTPPPIDETQTDAPPQPPQEVAPPEATMPVPGMSGPGPVASVDERIKGALEKHATPDSFTPRCPNCGSGTTGLASEDGDCVCHACGKTFKKEVSKDFTSSFTYVADHHDHGQIDTDVAADEERQPDIRAEQDSSLSWTDVAGEPLHVGEQYEMRIPGVSIPDFVTISAVKPDAIEYELTGEYGVSHTAEIQREEMELGKYEFSPANETGDEAYAEEPSTMDSHQEIAPGEVSDLSIPHMHTGALEDVPGTLSPGARDQLGVAVKLDKCPNCGGTGNDPDAPIGKCYYCKGKGTVTSKTAAPGYDDLYGGRQDPPFVEDVGQGVPSSSPQVHTFDSTGEAYDASQTNDQIKHGDILHVPNEGVTGYLDQAWPVAVTPESGAFHTVVDPAHPEIDQAAHQNAINFASQLQEGTQAGDSARQGLENELEGQPSIDDVNHPHLNADEYTASAPTGEERPHLAHLLEGGGMETVADQRTAGAKYDQREQRKFIDEQGEARNKDKLNLAGTHYEEDVREIDIFGDSFL